MLDINWIREHADEVEEVARLKNMSLSVKELIDTDDKRRELITKVEKLRGQRNKGSQKVGQLMKEGRKEEAEQLKAEIRELGGSIEQIDKELSETEKEYERQMMLVPNIVSEDTPIGKSDEDNVLVRQVGEVREREFTIKDHIQLGELHDLFDVPRGVKVGGSRSYYLKGDGVLLHRAVQQLALDIVMKHGFIPMDVPIMVREEALVNTGFFPTGRDQTYALEEEDKFLVGTSEVPLISYYAGEVVDVTEPIRLAAVSTSFRSEVGSAGRDVRGLYRVHQFAKVEMVVLTEANDDVSERVHQEITSYAEQLLEALELPYRVMAVCTGDMSQKTYKQYDIETWMPSRQAYGETHSSSNLHDFQARRSNIRYRDQDGQLKYVHTLNNTAAASPRILIPLLENHLLEDGSIYIPKALRPYMGGRDIITCTAVQG
ncbi:serine--tRNA ligase [Paenibacillus sp. J45TS6]|uniref:serine--tRNA ligase n=1 Tax=unclassified Paenibacillus TaxID=185978 RepID=UPI001B04D041|nr:serine--tRNA ligase [Paenibacillus sp. J45TS6]GIP44285.1 serine--tRNA ligase [Paenibacillus sp. J45TS6]